MRWFLLFLLLTCVPKQYVYVNGEVGDGSKVINISVDRNFGEADLVSIDRAINQWNYVLNGNIRLEVGGGGWDFLKIKDGHFDYDIVSWSGDGVAYIIRERISNEEMTGVVVYEIGHLLGVKGYEELDWEEHRCLDYKIMKEVSIAQGIPMENLSYCVLRE